MNRKEAWRWYWIAVLLGAAVILLSTCVRYVSVEMLPSSQMGNSLGYADCDMNGSPIIKIREDTNTYNYRSALIHEHEHAARMRRYGCNKFQERYGRDRDFAFFEEAAAYCAEAYAMVRTGVKASVAREYASVRLQGHNKGKHLTLDSVRKVLPCRGLQDTTRSF